MTALEILFFSLAYCCGSISSAVLVCQLFRLPDPRHTGSNNPGATNVYRIGGRIPAIVTLFFDVLKGFLPVYLGDQFNFEALALGLLGLSACLGHMYPLFFQFKGGKGVATALGALTAINPILALLVIAIWIVAVFLSGYSSVGALIAVVAAPFIILWLSPQYFITVSMIAILILLRHKQNIERLLQGQESKIWQKGVSRE